MHLFGSEASYRDQTDEYHRYQKCMCAFQPINVFLCKVNMVSHFNLGYIASPALSFLACLFIHKNVS